MISNVRGYVTDIPYLRDFKPMLAPAWLDHVALVAGVEPPAREAGFAWCELGCGQGVTAAILAATHSRGIFYGIDAMAAHIEHARRLATEARIANLRLHAADFTAADDLLRLRFDYIVAHGVYSWVDAESRAALRRLIDRHLAPGGLVYISYNAMPGWTRDLAFQHLLGELGRHGSGGSAARLTKAAGMIREMAAAGAPALRSSPTLAELEARPDEYPPAYLVHEFMHRAWQPLYVTELRAAMAEIGLAPVGSASLVENFDAFVLSGSARTLVARMADPDLRELARDFFLDQRLRCDVFDRGNRRLGAEERARRLLASSYGLARPAAAIRYVMPTPDGECAYDTPAARAIVAALADRPGRLAGLATASDLFEHALILCAAGDVMPVEPVQALVEQLNRAIWRRLDGAEEICWLALPCGTALHVEPGLLRALRDGTGIDDGRYPGWRQLLAGHGL